ncbi:hypothetical protein Sgly_0333 [Syntrophobotulus glycolicus DSM 8271]|uniref:Uncharacterized protein n=1 Tax=Syntrophobotulus glycolicus (strain DSM 8271 / FlGlyR) TaxID=645991 RepID=F0SXF3_SYNGF|nr:hypothetical protein Sgly_0333 [Syntrophobotulus glycolicus DSM 8271]
MNNKDLINLIEIILCALACPLILPAVIENQTK